MTGQRRILVIAGSDSSGGAGLEADQKVIAAHGCYAMTATTALTAQNTQGVRAIHVIPSDFVKQQIDACAEDIGIDVVKTGMLASATTVSTVAGSLVQHKVPFSVVDPVMVATSGAQLLMQDAVRALIDELLPVTGLLTPNVPEALLIANENGKQHGEIQSLEDLQRLAATIAQLGPKHVLVKGGHCPFDKAGNLATSDETKERVYNVLQTGKTSIVLQTPYLRSRNTHGTGCSLASAIACNIASGHDVEAAVRLASRYVEAGIRTSVDMGKGSGPINHFHSLKTLPFAPYTFIDYLLEQPDVTSAWNDFTRHEFVELMGSGKLPVQCFKFYMVQDYLYLTQFARANALAAYKLQDLNGIAASASIVTHIHTETALHVKECEDLGVTKKEMDGAEEHLACTAYSRYILDIGQSQDWLALQMAMLPCLLGYGRIAARLSSEQNPDVAKDSNRYRRWIDNYVADDYTEAVRKGCALAEQHALRQSPERIEELVQIFIQATKLETSFWDMGLSQR